MTQCSYRCLTPDGARCEHPAGHEGPHRNGLLIWHDPPMLFVDGKPYEPNAHLPLDEIETQEAICTRDTACTAPADGHHDDCPVEQVLLAEFLF